MSQVKVRRVIKQEIDVPDLGERFKQVRLEIQATKGVSLSKVCKTAGVSRNYWYQLEREDIKGALLEETLKGLEVALSAALNRVVDFGVKFDD